MEENMEIIVNDANFEQEVLQSKIPVLVDFWAEWCGPCRMLAPIIGQIAQEYANRLKVCKMNVEAGPDTSRKYDVMNIPTLMLFKNGQVVEKIVGVVPKNDIIARFNKHI
ncbi:MAG: thioredoxin [Candidatus Omnitrophota bacterium]